jgi:hypothetical protein
MATPLVPQEIYLLERYISLAYFTEMRDAWAKMLEAAEKALVHFELHLPPDYRNSPLPKQPDIVWGERVLPNFRSTLESLNEGLVLLSGGNLGVIAYGSNVQSAIKGQTSDYPTDWMPKDLETEFWYWQGEARFRAFNLAITEYGGWLMSDLTSGYAEGDRGPLNAPATWPIYQSNPKVKVKTGRPVVQSGIYTPACNDGCAQVLIKDYEAFQARVGFDIATTHEVSTEDTEWTLVERVQGGQTHPQHAGSSSEAGPSRSHAPLRCEAPGACPHEGFWFTPAQLGSRRFFALGEKMPEMGGDYGATIWQWDERQ